MYASYSFDDVTEAKPQIYCDQTSLDGQNKMGEKLILCSAVKMLAKKM